MQKWEYLHFSVNAYHQVIEVNGEKTGSSNVFTSRGTNKLWDVLNDLGQQGWEVSGFSAYGEHGWERVLLKRIVQE